MVLYALYPCYILLHRVMYNVKDTSAHVINVMHTVLSVLYYFYYMVGKDIKHIIIA